MRSSFCPLADRDRPRLAKGLGGLEIFATVWWRYPSHFRNRDSLDIDWAGIVAAGAELAHYQLQTCRRFHFAGSNSWLDRERCQWLKRCSASLLEVGHPCQDFISIFARGRKALFFRHSIPVADVPHARHEFLARYPHKSSSVALWYLLAHCCSTVSRQTKFTLSLYCDSNEGFL